MLDFIREIAQTLSNNRTRTILTGISVAWGIFMLIILVSMGRGVANKFESRADGSNTASIYPGRTSKPYGGYDTGRTIELTLEDVDKLLNDKDVLSHTASARTDDYTAVISSATDYIRGFQGVFPASFNKDYQLVAGRFINDQDINEKRKVIVLCEQNARRLFGDTEKAVGQRVSSLGLSWQVIGVYSNRWFRDSYVPISTLLAVKAGKPNVGKIELILDGATTAEESKAAVEAIRKNLGATHQFASDDESAVWVWDKLTNYLESRKAMGMLQTSIWLIGLLSLVSGIVGVSNIMFVSVRERTHEIGVRRAIGAKPRNILMQVIMESVAITTIFGYIGIVAGAAVMQLVNHIIANTGASEAIENPTVDMAIAFEVTLVLIVAGTLAGTFPALKALKVKPVEALRDE